MIKIGTDWFVKVDCPKPGKAARNSEEHMETCAGCPYVIWDDPKDLTEEDYEIILRDFHAADSWHGILGSAVQELRDSRTGSRRVDAARYLFEPCPKG